MDLQPGVEVELSSNGYSPGATMRASIPIIALGFAIVFITAPLGAQTLLDKAQRDEIARVAKGDPDMEVAFRKAKSTLPEFLALARAPRPSIEHFALKVAIHEGDATEYFWVSPFAKRNAEFRGRINNKPDTVHNVTLGQIISFKSADIFDWLYLENGKMIGNFTACALLKHEPPRDAEAFKKRYGLTCD